MVKNKPEETRTYRLFRVLIIAGYLITFVASVLILFKNFFGGLGAFVIGILFFDLLNSAVIYVYTGEVALESTFLNKIVPGIRKILRVSDRDIHLRRLKNDIRNKKYRAASLKWQTGLIGKTLISLLGIPFWIFSAYLIKELWIYDLQMYIAVIVTLSATALITYYLFSNPRRCRKEIAVLENEIRIMEMEKELAEMKDDRGEQVLRKYGELEIDNNESQITELEKPKESPQKPPICRAYIIDIFKKSYMIHIWTWPKFSVAFHRKPDSPENRFFAIRKY